jgi:uncharacterized protein YlaI
MCKECIQPIKKRTISHKKKIEIEFPGVDEKIRELKRV